MPLSVYGSYLRGFGVVTLSVLFFTLFIVNAGRVGTDWWLGVWSVDELSRDVGFYIGIYAAIACATSLVTFLHQICWAFGGIHSAAALHAAMFARVLRSPTSFFDTTPVGRILNRFSGDVSTVDKDIPTSFSSFVNLSARIFATVVVQAVILPWTLIGAFPIFALYVLVQQYYRHTSRELKRLDNVSKSPIFAHLSESLAGLSTIRAYSAQARFAAVGEAKLDANVRPYWKFHLVNRWLGLRLDWIGTLLVAVTALVAVLTAGSVSPGLIGLAISYALSITGVLNWLVRGATETETYLASVERMQTYSQLPVEAPPIVEGARPPAGWPSKGGVSIRNLTVRYRPELPAVLRGVSMDVEAGHKVAICGRTGSGKSSLMLALFRILEADEGSSISIDGVDTRRMGLEDLRSRLAIIPQDPTLFSGAVRYNLDPVGLHADEDLWVALERVHLGQTVRALGGLDAKLADGGETLSVGQRQLMCMARAFLRHARVLVLDEATASVDAKTDALVQAVVREVFASATVLQISHRLTSVVDCDRVVVMADGKVVETGHPWELLQKKKKKKKEKTTTKEEGGKDKEEEEKEEGEGEGALASMVGTLPPGQREELAARAQKSYEKRKTSGNAQ